MKVVTLMTVVTEVTIVTVGTVTMNLNTESCLQILTDQQLFDRNKTFDIMLYKRTHYYYLFYLLLVFIAVSNNFRGRVSLHVNRLVYYYPVQCTVYTVRHLNISLPYSSVARFVLYILGLPSWSPVVT